MSPWFDLAERDHALCNKRPRLDEVLTYIGLHTVRSLTGGTVNVERDHGDILCPRVADDFVQACIGHGDRDSGDIARDGSVDLRILRRVITTGVLNLKFETID